MNEKVKESMQKYISKKIGVEFKSCVVLFLVLFFYWVYCLINGSFEASIVHMIEMSFLIYAVCWFQHIIGFDFDDVDDLRFREWLLLAGFSVGFAAAAYLMKWFDGSLLVSGIFFIYMLCRYLCTFWLYKTKRELDAKYLNEDLKKFQLRDKDI